MFSLHSTHTAAQLALLRDILIENDTVTTLDISCDIAHDSIHQIVSDILEKNKTIESLFIRGQYFAENNRTKIFADLSHNKKIKKLLIHAGLGTQGYYSLSEMLKVNTTISYIIIQRDHIVTEEISIKHLNDALKVNTSLKTLILKVNVKRPDLLKEAIIYNTTLRLLHISCDHGEDVMDSFCASIEQNIGLETLILTGVNNYTKRILRSFAINSTVSNFSSEHYRVTADLTADDEHWIREIKGLTYTDIKNPILEPVLLENKMRIKNRKEDLKILLFNVARSTAALELAPIEIWQNIFRFLVYPGIFVGDLAEIIFPIAWTLDLGKKTTTNSNNTKSANNRSNNNTNNDNNNSSCILL